MVPRILIVEADPRRRAEYARGLCADARVAYEIAELEPAAVRGAEGTERIAAERADCVVLGRGLAAEARALVERMAALDPARRFALVLLHDGPVHELDSEAWLGAARVEIAAEGELTEQGLRRMVARALERGAMQRTIELRDREIAIMQSELQATFDELSDSHEKLKQANDLARYQATHDGLTGLAKRDVFMDQLEQALEYARRHKQSVGVLLVGLDRFRELNDTLGPASGDTVLRAVGERVAELTRRSDFCARVGGDEFAISLRNLTEIHTAARVASRIVQRLSVPYRVGDRELCITPSVGIALYPENGASADQLVGQADVAMKAAKREGGRAFRFYERQMNESAYDRLILENALRAAVKQGEIVLHYQPQVDIVERRVIGAEALVRWQHPERGLLSAGAFVPLAERSDLMLALGDWVLREALRQKLVWEDRGLGDFPISVNVSFRQVKSPDFCDQVAELLRDMGLAPSHVSLEITESMIMDDVDAAVEQLERLKRLGVRVSIDDFGTGYSSLSTLSQFPIDTLKIDRSFVQQIDLHERRAAIARAVVAMAHGLGFRTIAEGVETEAELAYLREIGCSGVQGYLIAHPLSAARFGEWLAQTKRR